MPSIKRICLWSGPRNISTALMYCFAQRKDTLVFDEPLYAHYLKNSNAKDYHPGSKEILETMENDGNKVVDFMLSENKKPVLFFKHMTKHLVNLDYAFMKSMINVILTRHPEDMIPSFAKLVETPNQEDVGYKSHVELIEYFKKNDIAYVVLDSKKVLQNPKKILTQLCNFINIPFSKNMLQWQAQQRPEDGIWAKYWYANVHKSTEFAKYKKKETTFPEHLKSLLKESLPYYYELEKQAIG